ncbi:hypothetical protein ACHAWF_006823 [Thalassiosira exigua]
MELLHSRRYAHLLARQLENRNLDGRPPNSLLLQPAYVMSQKGDHEARQISASYKKQRHRLQARQSCRTRRLRRRRLRRQLVPSKRRQRAKRHVLYRFHRDVCELPNLLGQQASN